MTMFFSFVVALFVTVVTIPPLMRVSGRLHLMDVPAPRKMHTQTVPRCGGIAIAIGTLLPVIMWVPMDRITWSYLIGAAIILVFGVWDDIKTLDWKWKILGQIAAVLIVIYGGGTIQHVPLFGLDPAPAFVTYPLTVLFLLGITNAVNLFDGLDGLAGGCVLLTLSAVAILAYEGNGSAIVLIALATMGSVFGFLRYNTHPASVFMGDAGSQFLGFTAAVLTILLIEQYHYALNPGVSLLLLGLPVLDTLMVMVQRITAGRSPFSADKNHIHHRLIGIGLSHYEAVCLIYVVQGLLVCSAFVLRYEPDTIVLGVFILFSLTILTLLSTIRRLGWRFSPRRLKKNSVERRNLWLRRQNWLPPFAVASTRYAIAGFLLIGALIPTHASTDISVLALITVGVSLSAMIFLRSRSALLLRLQVYLGAIFSAYLLTSWDVQEPSIPWVISTYLVTLTIFLILSMRLTRRAFFQVTPQDFLILFLAIAVPHLSGSAFSQYQIGGVSIMLIVILYASEFIITRDQIGHDALRLFSILSLAIISIRGIII